MNISNYTGSYNFRSTQGSCHVVLPIKTILKINEGPFVLRTHIRVFLCREKLMCRGKSAVNQTITPSIM